MMGQLAMVNGDYARFLESKAARSVASGFEIPESDVNPMLFPFQRDVAVWDLRRGKAANFMHTGTGKGPIQMEWCHHVSRKTDVTTLILARCMELSGQGHVYS